MSCAQFYEYSHLIFSLLFGRSVSDHILLAAEPTRDDRENKTKQ